MSEKISKESEIDKTLISQILKYKDLLRTKNYLSIQEREKDREKLNFLYDKLHTVKQKILDSKCYLHLGEIQKELASLLLQDETSHHERIFMLGYVLRCVCQPTIYIHSRGRITNYGSKNNQEIQAEEEVVYSEKPVSKFECKFKTKEISSEEIEQIKKQVKKIVKKTPIDKISDAIDWHQAEVLSQLAANKEVKLKIKADTKNSPLSVIVKGATKL